MLVSLGSLMPGMGLIDAHGHHLVNRHKMACNAAFPCPRAIRPRVDFWIDDILFNCGQYLPFSNFFPLLYFNTHNDGFERRVNLIKFVLLKIFLINGVLKVQIFIRVISTF